MRLRIAIKWIISLLVLILAIVFPFDCGLINAQTSISFMVQIYCLFALKLFSGLRSQNLANIFAPDTYVSPTPNIKIIFLGNAQIFIPE